MKFPVLSGAFCCTNNLREASKSVAYIHLVYALIWLFIYVVTLLTAFNLDMQSGLEQSGLEQSGLEENGKGKDSKIWFRPAHALEGFKLLIFTLVNLLLLNGVVKNDPVPLKVWMILTMLGFIHGIKSILVDLANEEFDEVITFCIVLVTADLYFIWVVYSFYRQISDNPDPPPQSEASRVELLDEDIPNVKVVNALT